MTKSVASTVTSNNDCHIETLLDVQVPFMKRKKQTKQKCFFCMFFYHNDMADILTISEIIHNSRTMLCSITRLQASFKMRLQDKTSL